MKYTPQSTEKRGFAQTGNAFQKHMPTSHQTDQNSVHDFVLAYDDFCDFTTNFVEPGYGKLEICFCGHNPILEQSDGKL